MHILFEDYYMLVNNKAAGVSTDLQPHGYSSIHQQNIDYLQEKYPGRKQYYLQPVHRLDRVASGVVIFAKTPAALKNISKQIELRSVEKKYVALVEGNMQNSTQEISHWLFKNNKLKKSIIAKPGTKGATEAILRYTLIAAIKNNSLLEVQLITGRYHQIRCQLSALGHPIINDTLYGATKMNDSIAIGLHASSYTFTHPKSNERMKCAADIASNDLLSALPWGDIGYNF